MSNFGFPYLSTSKATKQIESNLQIEPKKLTSKSLEYCLINDFEYPFPTGEKLSGEAIHSMSQRVLEIFLELTAGNYTYHRSAAIEFDKRITAEILTIFPMSPFDAAQKEVWNLITVRALPGVASWRFPYKDKGNYERYLGTERNTFGRLWQRANMLGPERACQLDEDELVQMFERGASIGSNPFVLQHLADVAISNRSQSKSVGGKTSALISETSKRLKRHFSLVSVEAMHDSEIKALVEELAQESIEVIKARRS